MKTTVSSQRNHISECFAVRSLENACHTWAP